MKWFRCFKWCIENHNVDHKVDAKRLILEKLNWKNTCSEKVWRLAQWWLVVVELWILKYSKYSKIFNGCRENQSWPCNPTVNDFHSLDDDLIEDEDLSQLSILNQFEGQSESWQQTRMSLIVKMHIEALVQIAIPF